MKYKPGLPEGVHEKTETGKFRNGISVKCQFLFFYLLRKVYIKFKEYNIWSVYELFSV